MYRSSIFVLILTGIVFGQVASDSTPPPSSETGKNVFVLEEKHETDTESDPRPRRAFSLVPGFVEEHIVERDFSPDGLDHGDPDPVRARWMQQHIVRSQDAHNVSQEELEKAKQVRELKQHIRSVEGTEREQALAELTRLLEEVFDTDFARRDAQLKKIESRVQEQRQKLEKYRAARERLIQMQIEQVTFEAEGIRFPTLNQPTPWGRPSPRIWIAPASADSLEDPFAPPSLAPGERPDPPSDPRPEVN